MDEAGRGPWAGPVVAAAVLLDRARVPPGLNDSKKLSPARREARFAEISETAQVGTGIAEVAEIDALNILRATDLAMVRAVAALAESAPAFAAHPSGSGEAHLLIDGNRVPPGLPLPATAVVKGDGRSLSIAAASIIAKVTRDRIMAALAKRHPGYGWETNQGYGTAAHREALTRLGITPHHRRCFAPIHKILCEERGAQD
ncbi:MAG: ribonuclease HII [Pseudomonadota bacterium]